MTPSPVTPPVDSYALAFDGGLLYDPLRRQAAAAPAPAGASLTLRLGDAVARVQLPDRELTAYAPVPLAYTLDCPDPARTLHLEVTTNEEPARRGGSPTFTTDLPGRVEVTYTYQGFVAGEPAGERPFLAPDFRDRPGRAFPGLALTPLRCSGELPQASRLWFRFTVCNTGDTLLDGNGNGSFMLEPVLERRQEDGSYLPFAVPSNLFYRLYDTLYPGESVTVDMTFGPYPGYPMSPGPLPEGEYRLRLAGILRSENKEPDFARVVWSGTPATVSYFYFRVTPAGGDTPPRPVERQPSLPPDRNGWLHLYEEFGTAFVTSRRREGPREQGVLTIQPAPWDTCLTVRLLEGDSGRIAWEERPLSVESASLHLTLVPEHRGYVRRPDGTREPAVATQTMADMRGGSALSPDAAGEIIGQLLDMRAAGINTLATTVAFAMEVGESPAEKAGGAREAFKFQADVLRALGEDFEGPLTYPYDSGGTAQLASAVAGEPLRPTPGWGDPLRIRVNTLAGNYLRERWGDRYLRLGDTLTPLCIEDTRGWIRYDQHDRYPVGDASKAAFVRWLRERYPDIAALNAAWGSAFGAFEEIDPERDGVPGPFGHRFEYRDPARVFHDYSPAMADWDTFRTAERRTHYRAVRDALRETLPDAGICLRTEGANWLVKGLSPDDPNPHLRHVVYSQRLNAMVAEELLRDDTVAVHSDYLTLPYTPAELALLTRKSTDQGVLTMHLPQFNRLRDIALNPRWGGTHYTDAFALPTPLHAAYLNTTAALYPCFQAVYENGGIPGLLWQDYLCDGYVTAVQYRELCFFRDKLREMLDTPEGRAWAAVPAPEAPPRPTGHWSYDPAYIRELVAERAAAHRPGARYGVPLCPSGTKQPALAQTDGTAPDQPVS